MTHCSSQGHYNNQISDREVLERGGLETDNSTRRGNQAAADGGICPETMCMPVVCAPTGGQVGARVCVTTEGHVDACGLCCCLKSWFGQS